MALIEQLRADDPRLGILVVSAWSTEESVLGALRVGATGYVLKERDDIEVSLSIRGALRGGAPINPFTRGAFWSCCPCLQLRWCRSQGRARR